jgi:hypothetical protein
MPDFDLVFLKKREVGREIIHLVAGCAESTTTTCYAILADALEEAGFADYSAKVRRIGQQKDAYYQWLVGEDDTWEWKDDQTGVGDIFDSIDWRFAPGWRKRYTEVPILVNIMN